MKWDRDGSEVVSTSTSTSTSIKGSTSELPAQACREDLLALVAANPVVVVCGETGSGKSTQIPQFLLESGMVSPARALAVTQPRRLAAIALAERVAYEQHSKLGEQVGYSVRFDDRSSRKTAIKFMTEGMLLREMLSDRSLAKYGVVMIDEAHERTVNADVLLSACRDLLAATRSGGGLKLVISSATLDAAKLARFFGDAPVFTIPGRSFPVHAMYATEPIQRKQLVDVVTATVLRIHATQPSDGDILVFLSGQDEIRRCEAELHKALGVLPDEAELRVMCLYSSMPETEQHRVFSSCTDGHRASMGCRRCILATNIAETSVTLPRVRFVVDSGLEKQMQYNGRQGVEALAEVRCSQASAKQRMGRAGRVSEGICYRLYTRREFATQFPAQTQPELLRSNLASVALMLMSFGAERGLLDFDWLDHPTTEAVVDAMQTLYALGAVNSKAKLTKLGRVLAEFPVDPRLAKCIVAAGTQFGADMCVVAAMLGEQGNLFESRGRPPAHMIDPTGDHMTLLAVFRHAQREQFSRRFCEQSGISFRALQRAKHVAQQLQIMRERVMAAAGDAMLTHAPCSTLRDAIVVGYFLNTARASHNRQDYVALRLNETVYVHPSSTLFKADPPAPALIFHELIVTSKEYMRGCLRLTDADADSSV